MGCGGRETPKTTCDWEETISLKGGDSLKLSVICQVYKFIKYPCSLIPRRVNSKLMKIQKDFQ